MPESIASNPLTHPDLANEFANLEKATGAARDAADECNEATYPNMSDYGLSEHLDKVAQLLDDVLFHMARLHLIAAGAALNTIFGISQTIAGSVPDDAINAFIERYCAPSKYRIEVKPHGYGTINFEMIELMDYLSWLKTAVESIDFEDDALSMLAINLRELDAEAEELKWYRYNCMHWYADKKMRA